MDSIGERDFADTITRIGGEAYVVGGWVRDVLRGVDPHDKDYVVTGVSEAAFESAFPAARRVGRRFPVYLQRIGGFPREVAFARREVKAGTGYRGFNVTSDSSVAIREDLRRRDVTINSMALRLGSPDGAGGLIDPFGGESDIKAGVIRAVSGHFADDPVRALRAARQSAQFGYSIEPGTVKMMNACGKELRDEPPERITGELSFALKTARPSVFFLALREAGLLDATFPWLRSIGGAGRDPEEDALIRAMAALDRAASCSGRPEIRFAALVSEIGKALEDWNRRMPLPGLWRVCAEFAIKERARIKEISRPGEITDFLTRVERHPIGIDGIIAVAVAGGGELPAFLRDAGEYYRAMRSISGHDIPESLAGPRRGEWLRAHRAEAVARLHEIKGGGETPVC